MICNCVMAGSQACKNCVNNHSAGNDYDYSKWFHIEIPSYSKEQLDYYTMKLLENAPRTEDSALDFSCNECKYYHRQLVEGIEFVNQNYCEKGINAASPAFWCKWGEVID